MKRLWNVLSFVAIVNLLSLMMFGGWLWQSGRLDTDRVRQVKDVFAQTIAEEEAALAQQQQQAQIEGVEAIEAARVTSPPLPSEDQVRHVSLVDDRARQAERRVKDETDQHRASLSMAQAQLDREKADFEALKQAWYQSIEEEFQRRTDEQFQKTVKLYESAKPKMAKQRMLNLISEGNEDQVVAYLDAMNSRAANKILNEFKAGEDPRLATELLERLRTFGIEAGAPEDSSNDNTPVNSEQPLER